MAPRAGGEDGGAGVGGCSLGWGVSTAPIGTGSGLVLGSLSALTGWREGAGLAYWCVITHASVIGRKTGDLNSISFPTMLKYLSKRRSFPC